MKSMHTLHYRCSCPAHSQAFSGPVCPNLAGGSALLQSTQSHISHLDRHQRFATQQNPNTEYAFEVFIVLNINSLSNILITYQSIVFNLGYQLVYPKDVVIKYSIWAGCDSGNWNGP